MPSVFAGAFSGSVLTAVGVWNFVSSSRPWRLAFQLQTEFDEERGSSREVVDNDADVVHPLDRHVLKYACGAGERVVPQLSRTSDL
jgi:hypothetical protein